MSEVPSKPKIFHIVHADRLASIIDSNCLWCDAEVVAKPQLSGTTIGMSEIKERRLTNRLNSHENLHVGDCVPFYFCPRSIMLYLIHQGNHSNLSYRGGQGAIVHLVADLRRTVSWAEKHGQRWAFTTSNAGSSKSESKFDDFCDLAELDKIDWNAVKARVWDGDKRKRSKQAEFLIEKNFPWKLVTRVGVHSQEIYSAVVKTIEGADHQPRVKIKPKWYY